MVLRYIAFAWDAQTPEASSVARSIVRRLKRGPVNWISILATEGLQIYQEGPVGAPHVYQLGRCAGVVLGKMFSRAEAIDKATCDVTFHKQLSEAVLASEGRYLVENCWGRYVAIFKSSRGISIRVLRDPTGAMPCFVTEYQNVNVICSHIDDCATLGLVTGRINWNHVAAYLSFHHLVSSETGLEGVRQVRAGECVSIGSDCTESTFYWSPYCVYSRRIVEDRQQAMHELRDTIQHCVARWASCYGSILHELSGGLDSAVVLSCLSRVSGPLKVICENNFTQDRRGDERVFARLAAKAAQVELVETPIGLLNRPLDEMFDHTRVATPALTAFVPEAKSNREQLVTARGIEAVFSGHGGDHLFQRVATPEIAAEFAWRHGLRSEILGIISDTSRFTRKPVWSVLASAVTSGLLRRHRDPYEHATQPQLIRDAVRDAIDRRCIRHPWVDCAADAPGSKRRQIFDILDSQSFYGVPKQGLDIVYPLMSQPIIELCLQIPSYVLTYDGVDRALVRQAFEGSVPSDIIARTTKGATTGYFNRLLVENIPLLRTLLLDGLLVAEGLLDKRKTALALSESSIIRGSAPLVPILVALRAEFWSRTWISINQKVRQRL